MIYRALVPEEYLKLQKQLLNEKGSLIQRQFLEAHREAEAFVEFMEERVSIGFGQQVPVLRKTLTEQSFRNPTKEIEEKMFETWKDFPPGTASRVSFWAGVTIEHIKTGKIKKASWLAGDIRKTQAGSKRITLALGRGGKRGKKEVDQCVRTSLMRMSGLPAARGNRSVFVNPPLGRGWWRERMVSRISERGGEVECKEALSDVVRYNQQYWENLIDVVVSRVSVFGSVDVLDAVVNGLAKHMRLNPNTPLRAANTLKEALRRFSNMAASREFGALDFYEVSRIVDHLLDNIERTLQNLVTTR